MTSTLSVGTTLRLGSVAVCIGFASAYLFSRQLDRWSPRVSLKQIPISSACRHLVDSAHAAHEHGDGLSSDVPSPTGCDKSGLLSPWPGQQSKDRKTHWIPSFVALQTEVPMSLLVGYKSESRATDADSLLRNFMVAFLSARARGLDGWMLDRNVPPLSFKPGHHLFGSRDGPGAWLLGTWITSSRPGAARPLRPQDLPPDVVQPVCEFSLSHDVAHETSESAGGVLYWKFPESLVRRVDTVASYGMPWRLMEGGFQEFIVEKISEETARVTYICVEASDLHPRGQTGRDWKRLPRLFYEAHVAYAQILLLRAMRELRLKQSK